MFTIPMTLYVANAATRFSGRHRPVTRQAQEPGCSRQAVDNHASEVVEAFQVKHSDGLSGERLLRQNQELRRENGQLWDWLNKTIAVPPAKRKEFAVRAAAMGLSLNPIVERLAPILGTPEAPARSPVHRRVRAAAIAAGTVLQRIDRQCKDLVKAACLDENFFHGHPVLVGVEPASMVLFLAFKCVRLNRLPGSSGSWPGMHCRIWSRMRGSSSNRRSPGSQRKLWWFRHRSRANDEDHQAKAILLQEVICWKLAPDDWSRWYSVVAATLRATVRASSVVACVNSVLRMQQARHRTLNQELLDLKRLCWSTRRFRIG